MSTDRELLEMAAKAAGIKVYWCDQLDVGLMDPHIVPHPRPHFKMRKHPNNEWNPLTDDGDALRLAVKLRMDISVCAGHVTVEASSADGECRTIAREKIGGENNTADVATRCAIVRAAAEIGRAMP